MRGWLIFRPSDEDFDLNVQNLYQERNLYDLFVVLRHLADRRVKYVRMLGEYLAFADFREVGETRVHVLREISEVQARVKR